MGKSAIKRDKFSNGNQFKNYTLNQNGLSYDLQRVNEARNSTNVISLTNKFDGGNKRRGLDYLA